MNHNYAIENHVAEGYLLDELDETERDAYEDHYFGCTTCAEEVEIVSEFIDTAKQVIREESRPKPVAISTSPNWFRRITAPIMHPLPAALGMLLLMTSGVMVYQSVPATPVLLVVSLSTPRITLTSAHAAQEVTSVPKGEPVLLTYAVPPEALKQHFDSYQADVVTDSGIVKFSSTITPQKASAPVKVTLPTSMLKSGKYFVVIRGVNSNQTESGIKGELARLPFELKLQ